MFWDRRKGDRRAQSAGKAEPDRRGQERRRWACGILYRTSLPAQEIETWLALHATGEWGVALEGIEENLGGKVLKIMFEDEDDKRRFIAAFSGR
jgi:hypothetical protein